jgi:hypothetical protein
MECVCTNVLVRNTNAEYKDAHAAFGIHLIAQLIR